MSNKGHTYKHEDADCSCCGSPWEDIKSYCPVLNEYQLEEIKKEEQDEEI